MSYVILADFVLIAHLLYVLFVVGGLIMILLGSFSGWKWVRNFYFRVIHLAAICGVVFLSWLEIVCPLTTLEVHYRYLAGQTTYQETFIAHWAHKLLFFEAPVWMFSIGYSLFGLAVIATWAHVRPQFPWLDRSNRHKGENNRSQTP